MRKHLHCTRCILPFQEVIGTIGCAPPPPPQRSPLPTKHEKTPFWVESISENAKKTPKNGIFSETNPPPAKMAFGECFWMA